MDWLCTPPCHSTSTTLKWFLFLSLILFFSLHPSVSSFPIAEWAYKKYIYIIVVSLFCDIFPFARPITSLGTSFVLIPPSLSFLAFITRCYSLRSVWFPLFLGDQWSLPICCPLHHFQFFFLFFERIDTTKMTVIGYLFSTPRASFSVRYMILVLLTILPYRVWSINYWYYTLWTQQYLYKKFLYHRCHFFSCIHFKFSFLFDSTFLNEKRQKKN